MKRGFLFICCVVLGNVCLSQNAVSLTECQTWAAAQSAAGVQQQLQEEFLQLKLKNASAHLLPSFEMNGEISYQSHVPQLPLAWGVDELSKGHSGITLDFEQSVFQGGKYFYTRDYEKLNHDAELFELQNSINQLKEEVLLLYLNALIVDQQILLLASVENTINEQLQQLNALLKEGVVYGNAVAQLELEALKLEQQKNELLATKKTLARSLTIITGKDLSSAQFIVPELPEVTTEVPSQRIEYEQFNNQHARLDFQKKLHLSKNLPHLSVFATGGYGRPTYDIFSNQFDWFYMVGARIKVPITPWFTASGVEEGVQLQKKLLASKESDFTKFNTIKIEEKGNEIAKIEAQLALDHKIINKHAEIIKIAKVQLLNGEITAYDFIQQRSAEMEAQLQKEVHALLLIQAKYELMGLLGL